MGMFDTIMLDEGLVCPVCGHEETSIQTHELGNSLDTYRVGMILPYCPVMTGVIREQFYCSKGHHKEQEKSPDIYLVIWHTILVGVLWTEGEADRLLQSVDRLNLVEWLGQMQKQAQQWQKKYNLLRSDLERWHKYVTAQQEGQPAQEGEKTDRHSAWKIFCLPDEEIRNAEDPLWEILKRNAVSNAVQHGSVGLGWG